MIDFVLRAIVAAKLACGLAIGIALAFPAGAQQPVTLRLHSYAPPGALDSKLVVERWAEKVQKESNGRLVIQIFPRMILGGTPADLVKQVVDGTVDLVFTLPGYTPGRFPRLDGLELPFISNGAEATSLVAWDFYEKYAKDDFKDMRLISMNSSDYGFLMTADKDIQRLEDVKGLKIRAASRYIGIAVTSLGGVPQQMPLTSVYEAMSRGQVQGMMMAWAISRPFKLLDVSKYQIEMPFYHSILTLLMNSNSYDKLPNDLKKVIDANSGRELGRFLGQEWDKVAKESRDYAIKRGNKVVSLPDSEVERWRAASSAAHQAWVDEMNAKGFDGKAMLAELKALGSKHTRK